MKGKQTTIFDSHAAPLPPKHLPPRPGFEPSALVPIGSLMDDGASLNAHAIEGIKTSIQDVGLLHPIVIDGERHVIAGRKRVAACRALGYTEIAATTINFDGTQRELAVIDENLAREQFTVLELAKLLARHKPAYERLHPETKQHVAGGVARAAGAGADLALAPSYAKKAGSQLGKSERTVQDLLRIGTLDDDASSKLAGTPVEDKATTLLELAKAPAKYQSAIAGRLAGDAKLRVSTVLRELEGGATTRAIDDEDAIGSVARAAKKTLRAIEALSSSAKRKVPASEALVAALGAFIAECAARSKSGVAETAPQKKKSKKAKGRGNRARAAKANTRSAS